MVSVDSAISARTKAQEAKERANAAEELPRDTHTPTHEASDDGRCEESDRKLTTAGACRGVFVAGRRVVPTAAQAGTVMIQNWVYLVGLSPFGALEMAVEANQRSEAASVSPPCSSSGAPDARQQPPACVLHPSEMGGAASPLLKRDLKCAPTPSHVEDRAGEPHVHLTLAASSHFPLILGSCTIESCPERAS